MLSGLPYSPLDAELVNARLQCKQLLKKLNTEIYTSGRENSQLLKQLLPFSAKDALIEPPFLCEYGFNIKAGKRLFVNVNCVFLDAAEISIGNNVLIGHNEQLYTSTHPTNALDRKVSAIAKPIHIASDVWIGGNAVVLPGVSIGEGSVVAAASVVTKDVPAHVMVAGNPAKIIKQL